MDRYLLSNVPHIVDLQRMTAQTIETRNVTVFSIYWKSDDTGSAEGSSLFIQALSKLQNVQTCQRSLSDKDRVFSLGPEVVHRAASQSGSRKLFILHYAGHAIAGSTPDSLGSANP